MSPRLSFLARCGVALLAAALLLPAGAAAQQKQTPPKRTQSAQPAKPQSQPQAQSAAPKAGASLFSDSEGPLVIEADDGIEWLREEKRYVARGNAAAIRGDMKIAADVLSAIYAEREGSGQQIQRVEAAGNVRIFTKTETAYGDTAVYNAASDDPVFVLIGKKLRIESAKGVIYARDSLEYWEKREIAVARGDAFVVEGDNRLKADVLVASMGKNPKTGKQEVVRIDADGNIHVSTPTDIVRGEKGVYNLLTDIVKLCGNVRITRGQDQLNGSCAEVNLKTGISRLVGGQSGRVRGLFTPPAGR
ncbi:MAG: LptA/OstA family protein [Alphaproteobacteria bacterium]